MSNRLINAIQQLKAKKYQNAISRIFDDAKFENGPLDQKIITIKDLFVMKNTPTRASSQILDNYISGYDATIIKKINQAGGAIVAKTHLDELALGGDGLSSSYGQMSNSIDSKRLVGGSSSGAIFSMSENIDIAVGSDTGDSVRLPASYNGKVGFKPSYGAVSRFGMIPFASSLDTVAWFSHNVADSVLMAETLFGEDKLDMTSKFIPINNVEPKKPLKIGFLNTFGDFSEKIEKEYKNLFNTLENNNLNVEMIEIDRSLLEAIEPVYDIISFSESSSNNSNLTGIPFGNKISGLDWNEIMSNTRTEKLGSMPQKRFILGSYYLLAENQEKLFKYAQKVRRIIVNEFNRVHSKFDILVSPASEIAPLIEGNKSEKWISTFLAYSNMEGSPAISIPWSKEEGLPFNLHLSSKIYSDEKLLSYAWYLENILKDKHE